MTNCKYVKFQQEKCDVDLILASINAKTVNLKAHLWMDIKWTVKWIWNWECEDKNIWKGKKMV